MSGIEIVVIMDRSGSMESVRSDMQGGLNNFVEEQQKIDGDATLTFARFDDRYEMVHEGVPIRSVEADELELSPRGMTALHDGVGKTLSTVWDNRRDAKVRNGKVVVLIVTDGLENASTEWTKTGVKEKIEVCEANGWEIVYLGANVDAFSEGGQLGTTIGKSVGYDPTAASIAAMYTALNTSVSNFRSGDADGVVFTAAQRNSIKAGEGFRAGRLEREELTRNLVAKAERIDSVE